MKKLGITIDGVIRNYLDSFDKQYRKTFIHNANLVQMDKEFQYREPSEQELIDLTKKIEDETKERITLPVDSGDLLNHYQFKEISQFEVENVFSTPKESVFNEYKMQDEFSNKILTPEEALHSFMYEKYPFKIFGDAEEFQNAMSHFNRIQAFGIQNKLFETILISDLKSNAITANFYFLHKSGCRARNIQIVENDSDKWNYCDVLVDASVGAFQTKPEGKIAVKIERLYNQYDEADYTLKSLKELNSEKLLRKLFE